MKIDAFTRLFSANSPAYKAQPTKNAVENASESENSEAVKVYAGFGAQGELSETERQEKVARLKKQVADGTYTPDLTKVANALAKELFA